MPGVDVTENSIRIRRRNPGEFKEGSFRTIVIDKTKGIKAVIGRLKGEEKTSIQTIIFPKDNFSPSEAEKWVKDHNMEHYFVKELLYPGTFPHPQDNTQEFSISDDDISDLRRNVVQYLRRGGDIAVTFPPHPEEVVDKIKQTVGYLNDVFIEDGKLFSVLALNDEASDWILNDKVKTVSPSLVYEVQTAHGQYRSLLDHVCITPDPFMTKQTTFEPIAAESYSHAVVLFEGTSMKFKGDTEDEDLEDENSGGGIMNEIKKMFARILEAVSGQSRKPESEKDEEIKGDNEMKEIEELQKANAALVAENLGLKKSVETMQKQFDAQKATELNAELESFKAEVEELIKAYKMLPKDRDYVVAVFESLRDKKEIKFQDTAISIADTILKPYRDKKPKPPALEGKVSNLKIGDREFDRSTLEGRNEFSEYVSAVARREKISYEEARKKVLFESSNEGGS